MKTSGIGQILMMMLMMMSRVGNEGYLSGISQILMMMSRVCNEEYFIK